MTWKPSASIDTLIQRARILKLIRSFFHERGYLEVETPAMAKFGVTDVYLSNIKATFRQQSYCLQTSPEYHMKRLLAAGSGPIFQLARVFRDDELGRWHNPEFTMLEWYQLDINHHALMAEMDDLLQIILECPPLVKQSYRQVFQDTCGIDPFLASIDQFKAILNQFELDNVLASDEEDRDQYLFLLMSHVVEPAFAKQPYPLAIYDFPPSQAALARLNKGVAERFEIYFRGVELANGFHELTDAKAQMARFQQDSLTRKEKGLPEVKPDTFLMKALQAGLPACSGVAMGIDRLLALALQKTTIADVLAFDFSRA